jgi:hypothetical protein
MSTIFAARPPVMMVINTIIMESQVEIGVADNYNKIKRFDVSFLKGPKIHGAF